MRGVVSERQPRHRTFKSTQQEIHAYWVLERPNDAADWFRQVDVGEPSCYGCGYYVMEDGDPDPWVFERAHLIDRAQGGLDGPQNVILLCQACHAPMPTFVPGQEQMAISWVAARPNFMYRAAAWVTAAHELFGLSLERSVELLEMA